MTTGISPAALYCDALKVHDFRDPETWQRKPAEGWTTKESTVVGITLSGNDPVLVQVNGHGMSTGHNAKFMNVGGTEELNGKAFKVTVVDADNFTLDDTDSADFSAWTSGGDVFCNNYDSSFVIVPSNGQAITIPEVEVKISSDTKMHSPLLATQRKKDLTIVKQSVYSSLDDFLDKFTSFKELSLTRYEHPIEFHTYELDQPVVLRSADTPSGALVPYLYSMELKIQDDQPYKANGTGIEYMAVRYRGVGFFIDQEYVSE